MHTFLDLGFAPPSNAYLAIDREVTMHFLNEYLHGRT